MFDFIESKCLDVIFFDVFGALKLALAITLVYRGLVLHEKQLNVLAALVFHKVWLSRWVKLLLKAKLYSVFWFSDIFITRKKMSVVYTVLRLTKTSSILKFEKLSYIRVVEFWYRLKDSSRCTYQRALSISFHSFPNCKWKYLKSMAWTMTFECSCKQIFFQWCLKAVHEGNKHFHSRF